MRQPLWLLTTVTLLAGCLPPTNLAPASNPQRVNTLFSGHETAELQLSIRWPQASEQRSQTVPRVASRLDVSVVDASASLIATASLERPAVAAVSTASLILPVGLARRVEATAYAGDESVAAGRSDPFDVRRNLVAQATVSLSPLITSPIGSEWGYGGDGGPASQAMLDTPEQLSFGPDGTLYMTDRGRYTLRTVTPDGFIHTFLGENGRAPSTTTLADEGVPAADASLYDTTALYVNVDGDVYFEDQRATDSMQPISDATGSFVACVRFIPHASATYFGRAMQSGKVYTIYRSSSLRGAMALIEDLDKSLLIADSDNGQIMRLARSGVVDTFLGVTSGPATNATPGASVASASAILGTVAGLVMDTEGNLLFTDVSDTIRILVRKPLSAYGITSMQAGHVYTLLNRSQTLPAGRTKIYYFGMALDSAQNLYVSDFNHNEVYRLSRSSGRLERVVGLWGSTAPAYGDGGAATGASLAGPRGLAFDTQNRLYVADMWNALIRRVCF